MTPEGTLIIPVRVITPTGQVIEALTDGATVMLLLAASAAGYRVTFRTLAQVSTAGYSIVWPDTLSVDGPHVGAHPQR